MKYILHLLLLVSTLPLFAQSKVDEVLDRLDSKIKEQYIYKVEKERRINALKFNLSNTEDTNQKYTISQNIFEEYKAYQYDSAYLYAIKSLNFAKQSGDINNIAQANCDLLFCYSTVGFFKEAEDIVANFSYKGVSNRVMVNFYEGNFRYYNNLRMYVGNTSELASEYEHTSIESANKAMELLNPDSFKYKFIKIQRELYLNKNYNDSIDDIKELLQTPNLSTHNQAILYSWLGLCYEMKSDRESAIYYITLSAIADIESCTYETTSAKVLARYMYENGDISRANEYINLAFEDANTYNSHIRRLEIQAIMPSISAERYDNIVKDRRYLIGISIIVGLLSILVVVMSVKVYHRNSALRVIRSEVEERAAELSQINEQLKSLNDELAETNKIKDLYIIESLYGDSHFVDNVEKMCKALIRKIKAKQFSDILEVVGGMGIKRERQRMATAFDSAFLKLFPKFIDEYNKLFSEDDAIKLNDSCELPTEVRIFALIRLGIEDSSQIAKYLNLSLNTVYVYKAKVKARTIVAKDEFEERIKQIV